MERGPIFFLYGSQTGNAECIAKMLHNHATTSGSPLPDGSDSSKYQHAQVMTLNAAADKGVFLPPPTQTQTQTQEGAGKGEGEDASNTKKKKITTLVIICSTSGDADFPDNAFKFKRWLNKNVIAATSATATATAQANSSSAPSPQLLCQHIRYTVLALGDSNYNMFCAAGKKIDLGLEKLGAARFYPRGMADDGLGLDSVVDPWTASLWPALDDTNSPAVSKDSVFRDATGEQGDQQEPPSIVILYHTDVTRKAAGFLHEALLQFKVVARRYPLRLFEPWMLGDEWRRRSEKTCPPSVLVCFHDLSASSSGSNGAGGNGGGRTPFHSFLESQASLPSDSAHRAIADPVFSAAVVEYVSGTGGNDNGARMGELLEALGAQQLSLSAYEHDASIDTHSMGSVGGVGASGGGAGGVLGGSGVEQLLARDTVPLVTKITTSGGNGGAGGRKSGGTSSVSVSSHRQLERWCIDVLCAIPNLSVGKEASSHTARVQRMVENYFAGHKTTTTAPLTTHSVQTNDGNSAAERHADASSGVAASGGVQPTPPTSAGGAVSTSASRAASASSATAGRGGVAARDRGSSTTHFCYEAAGLGVGSGVGGQHPHQPQRLFDIILKPVVLLHTGETVLAAEVAQETFLRSQELSLSTAITEVGNFKSAGFPRRAVFLFFLGEGVTNDLKKILKFLRNELTQCKQQLQQQHPSPLAARQQQQQFGFGRPSSASAAATGALSASASLFLPSSKRCEKLKDLSFGILSIDDKASNSNAFAGALELEALLTALGATKIHPTGLADVSAESGIDVIVAPWTAALWRSIEHMTRVTHATGYLEPSSAAVLTAMGGGTASSSTANLAGMVDGDDATQQEQHYHYQQQHQQTFQQQQQQPFQRQLRPQAGSSNASWFPWEAVPIHVATVSQTPLCLLYTAGGLPKHIATCVEQEVLQLGFPAVVLNIKEFHSIYVQTNHVIVFCDVGPDLTSSGFHKFRRVFGNPSHPPDLLAHVKFSVVAVGQQQLQQQHVQQQQQPQTRFSTTALNDPATMQQRQQQQQQQQQHVHPYATASRIAHHFTHLGASRVFPVGLCHGLSNVDTYVLPWARGVLGAMTTLNAFELKQQRQLQSKYSSSASSLPDAVAALPRDKKSILFLYGSVTGTCEAIARDFHREATAIGLISRVASMKDFQRMGFTTATFVVFVCSSTGKKGQLPSNAAKFGRYINHKSLSATHLEKLDYAVLALGSSRYGEYFGAAGKLIDARCAMLGARRFCDLGLADEESELETSVESFRTVMFDAISEQLSQLTAVMQTPQTSSLVVPTQQLQQSGRRSVSPEMLPADQQRLSSKENTPQLRSVVGPALGVAERPSKILILYGSQTGNAEAIADIISAALRQLEIDTTLGPLNHYERLSWRRFRTVLVVCSTTGTGEFPENSHSFVRFINKKSHPQDLLSGMRYAVLALGDQNYSRFCHAGKVLDRRFEEIGATRILARGDADDGVGLNDVVDPWVEQSVLFFENEIAKAAAYEAKLQAQAEQQQQIQQFQMRHNKHRRGSSAGGDALGDLAPLPPSAMATHADSGGGGADGSARKQHDVSPAPLETSSTCSSNLTSGAEAAQKAADKIRFTATIKSSKFLTTYTEPEQSAVVQLCLDVSGVPQLKWQPGDAVAIYPVNDDYLVDKLLRRLRVNHPDDVFIPPENPQSGTLYRNSPIYSQFTFPITNRQLISRHLTLRLYNKHTLQILLKHTRHPTEQSIIKAWMSHKSSEWQSVVNSRTTILDLLEKFPMCHPPFRHIVEHLAVMQPRYYSIASAYSRDPTQLDIAFKIVPKGLCTNWLLKLSRLQGEGQQVEVPLSLRSSAEFRVPQDPQIPLVMIGPGTGVSPFISFLQHREQQARQASIGASATEDNKPHDGQQHEEGGHQDAPLMLTTGESHLFFGCRRHDTDFLFHDEIYRLLSVGALRQLHVAFSQEKTHGNWYGGSYVQDKLQEYSLHLSNLILNWSAYIFVCGDAESMAQDVHCVLIDILEQGMDCTTEEATAMLNKLSEEGRYQRDVWS